MEFCLRYSGPLKSQDNAAGKHRIRQVLHSQIKSLCTSEPFGLAFKEDLDGTRKRGRNRFLWT
jgi:hypothetical protein